MAVYTHLDDAAIGAVAERFGLATPVEYRGIESGIENTNYLLSTPRGRFILTLFEKRVRGEDLPFVLSFMRHLGAAGIPVAPVTGAVFTLAEKPALLTGFLAGAARDTPDAKDAAAAGEMLGRMHRAAESFTPARANSMGRAAWRQLLSACDDTRARDTLAALDALEKNWPAGLPAGAVHADFFPDNVFFEGDAVSGVIDFYFACTDTFAYDLMLAFNPWCFRQGVYDAAAGQAFLQGYESARPLSADERAALPFFGQAAAIRIIATRLYDSLHPATGALVTPKDPAEHIAILRHHQGRAA